MQNARCAAAISRARLQVKPTTFPMMLSYNGNCLLRLSIEQSGKVEYERERLLGIANKFINFLAIPSSLSRSYSTFPLCSGTTLIEIAV